MPTIAPRVKLTYWSRFHLPFPCAPLCFRDLPATEIWTNRDHFYSKSDHNIPMAKQLFHFLLTELLDIDMMRTGNSLILRVTSAYFRSNVG